ncbi:MAG TPA: DMT family transporter [Geminicoccus sp.]|jgi:drug/metabolite transporter (DMT)-like permease|uniref:aromatic amino acid exporter YddG n=1 Tax=Geminicoccus sp. TaxID=2024832 RepID=UPI002E2EBEE8|nr:DMT family transporter [Geminicoccus sp.]HEX2528767.1 DMT family transporter [Geminicoccus sp.]
MPDRRPGTLIGMGAILLWATLAPLGVALDGVPPFLLTGAAFLIGGVFLMGALLVRGQPATRGFQATPLAWAIGVGGFFGYHAVYFTALKLLPPVDALLVINLWPLLIVLFSALLPGERLLPRHVVGALLGLGGTSLIVLGRGEIGGGGSLAGWLCALAAALIWSGYSILNRRFAAATSSDAVIGFCLATAVLSLAASLLVEQPVLPQGHGWAMLVLLGLGPVGLAFLLWDRGTKSGDIRVLGAAAYAGPLIGTLLLLVMGRAEPSWRLLLAALLIVGGSLLASGDLLGRRQES